MEDRLRFGAFRGLQSAGVTRQFSKRRTVLFQGEIPRGVLVLESGLVKVYGITNGGDQRTVTLLSPGDIFPVECVFGMSRVSLYYYEALTDCSVLNLPKEEFIAALERDSVLKDQIFQAYMAHYTSATMHIYALEHSHAQEKLVYILQYLVARFGEKQGNGLTRIGLRLSHQDIAEMVGLTRETTAVELHRLKAKKLISYQRFSYYVNVPLLVAATGAMNSKTLRSDLGPREHVAVDYWRLFRDMPEPYLLFEASEPYRIVEINQARERLAGVMRAKCVGRPLFKIYPYTNERFRTTVAKGLREQLREIVRTGHSYQIETWGQDTTDMNGVQRTIYVQAIYSPIRNEGGDVTHILVAAHDVTDELHAIERAATAESRLNAALTIGKVGSWVFDATTKRILGDENFIKLFRMTKKRAATFDIDAYLESIHEEDRPRIATAVKRSIKELVPFEEEYRVRLNDGSQRWVLARGKAETHNGHTVFPGVVVDITEQRDLRAQIELARQQDLLNQQATRVLQKRNEELKAISRSKDEFVALASHQLRTPATAVKQYIGMVLQGYVGDITEEQSDVLTKAFESNERQIQIINQILSAARVDTGRLVMTPMPIDLRALIQGIATDMDTSLQQHQHLLTLDLPKHTVQVAADLGYLRMAIENVVHNASVYTHNGGSITIKLKRVGSKCTLFVTDTGVGIRKADLGKLFVKFSRIHNPLSVEAGGSGIGLYLTAEIVRLHGGSISVDSHVNKGTTFAISLPLMQNKHSTEHVDRRE